MILPQSASQLSVVIPVFNEETHLEERICYFVTVLDVVAGPGCWEIRLIDNGSADNTAAIIDSLSKRWTNITAHSLPNPNYGLAIRHGVTESDYTFVFIVDLDQWDDAFIRWAWRYRQSYDLIVSSKRADPSINQQSRLRFVLSWGLNAVLQLLFAFPGSDTHGQKLFNRKSLEQILVQTKADRGQYDVELVVRSLRAGKNMIELPVPYKEMRPGRNALIKKVVWNIWALSKLAWRLHGLETQSVRLRRISRLDVENGRGFDDDA
jgi:glycosyltransferase involved in cell wall biosynthesis